MQAILLLAHKGYDYIDNFCKQFANDKDFNIYIHIDVKTKITDDEIINLKNDFQQIKYITQQVDCKYSDISIVNAEIILINEALKDNPDYCHLMSEQCYITVDLDIFKNYFINNDREYIWISDMIGTESETGVPNCWRIINKKYHYFGAQWFSLTGKILTDIMSNPELDGYIQENIDYCNNKDYDKTRQAVDETFFQNFIMEFGYFERYNVMPPHHRDNQSLRFVDWLACKIDREDTTHPEVLGINKAILKPQTLRIVKDNYLIIRKIDYKNSASYNYLKLIKELYKKKYMSNSDVTVCMCTRNRDRLMLPSIKCILDQTYNNFDFLIVDDASTDSTVNVVNQLMKKDNKIKLLSLSQHNFINARNSAFRNATGKYIALIDSDDKCSPDKLLEQVKYLDEHPDVDVVGCKIKFGKATSTLSIPKSTQDWDNEYFQNEIKTENISMLLHFPSIMIRKEALDRIFPNKVYFYPELENGGEDQIFLYTMYMKGAKFANVSKPTYLYNYLEYDDSISSGIGKHFDENNFIFKYIHNKPFEEKMKIVEELYEKYNK